MAVPAVLSGAAVARSACLGKHECAPQHVENKNKAVPASVCLHGYLSFGHKRWPNICQARGPCWRFASAEGRGEPTNEHEQGTLGRRKHRRGGTFVGESKNATVQGGGRPARGPHMDQSWVGHWRIGWRRCLERCHDVADRTAANRVVT